ncbi:MAG: RtcB family protein [Clostridiales bacterium]|jgi:RNA-splicing ligase RtcB|nr:RtcB family protein [Clostridiales bacterium]
MIKIQGTYNFAICYCDEIEDTAIEQIQALCNQPDFAENKIRIMPDVHAGKGCVIGTTMTVKDKIVPGMVGVDIGCGMETVEIAERDVDFSKLDKLIRSEIPSGREVREDYHIFNDDIDFSMLRCSKEVNIDYAKHSIGTLGGGNHFIEIDRSDNGTLFIIVHSGSRHIGTEVANYYQNKACNRLNENLKSKILNVVAQLKAKRCERDIQSVVKLLKDENSKKNTKIPKELAYVSDIFFNDYIHDMKIIQRYASLNRKAIIEIILHRMKLSKINSFTTIHNYIDTYAMILRKGAVSARDGEILLIPINMRDGSLICIGKGNDEWNCSAPHGAGRVMSRKKAFDSLSMREYQNQMKNIFTTSVSQETLDESPMAYKNIESIIKYITPTVDIVQQIRPVYNFKANE